MNSELPNPPEDRLLDELLHEQSHGPDEAFLQQIEQAIDAGPPLAKKLPAPRRYGRLAVAAGIGLAAGISFFYHLESRDAHKKLIAARERTEAALAKENEQQELEKAIRDQEDKVEERRKLLAIIVRTKGIIYKGQDSFYGQSGVDEDAGAQTASDQIANNSHREDAIKRGLDLQDYVDATRDLETDRQRLQELKLAQGSDTTSRLEFNPNLPLLPPVASNEGSLTNERDLANNTSGSGRGTGFGKGRGVAQADKLSMPEESQFRQPRARIVPPPASAAIAGKATTTSDRTAGNDGSRAGGFIHPANNAPESNTGDRYGAFIDQPWKSPDRDPLSTFSIDVDTASYANVRRMIREGRAIPKDAVRIEEFINAFQYNYDAPKGDGPFAVGADLSVCPWAPDHQLVRVSIKGREIEPNKRPASNLVFLIDVSGSMQSPDKLPLLKQSMATLVGQLDERDRVAIVVYAGSEGVALPSTRLDAQGRSKVLTALTKLDAGGSTNGGAGIKRAYQLAMDHEIAGGVNRVILATDGDFNVGVTGQEALVKLVKERAKNNVYLTVAGFGSGNLNDAMMDAITRDGNGNYFYIDSEREGRKVFLQNLAGTLVTIAKDVKIQVEFNPAKVGSYRLIGYANRVLRNEDFSNDRVDAGDIGAGHTVTAFYELMPPGATPAADVLKYQTTEKPAVTDDWLTVKLRHKHPEGDESSLIEFPLTGIPTAVDQTDSDFQFATAAALLGMKLRNMEEAKGIGWNQVIALAKPGLANDVTEERAEFIELVKMLSDDKTPDLRPQGASPSAGKAEVIPTAKER